MKPKRRAKVYVSQNETGTAGKGPDQSARQTLLKAAKRLFAHKGLTGTSIRDIAKEAGMNSSMISYYFDGKEGLYRECLREIGETRLHFATQILKPPQTLEEYRIRLRLMMENLFTLFLEDRETGLIVVREYDRIHSPAEEIFKSTFLRIFDLVIEFFQQAQKKKIIDRKKDPFILASLFFGTLSSQMRLDHIKEKTYKRTIKDETERERLLEHMMDLFTIPT